MATTTSTQINIATQKITVEAEYEALINGMNTELANVDPIVLIEQSYPRAALIAEFQKRVDAAEATKTARNNLHTCVAQEKTVQTEVAPLRMAMKQYLQSRYGKNSPKLQLFGFTQAKKPAKTVASKMAAVTNAKATRVARNTMGKKQKLKVKGAPSPGGTTPSAASSASAPAATPATTVHVAPPPSPPATAPTPLAAPPAAAAPSPGRNPITGATS
jgi:hypothetical protein